MAVSDSHRDYVYGMHNNVPEGPSYPIRTVSDGTYRYIRNLRPENLYIEKHLMGHPAATRPADGNIARRYWDSWIWNSWEDDRTRELVERYLRRPAEELYHTADDPYELENLAGSMATREKQRKLSAELDRWMAEQGDPGVEQDTRKSLQAARRGEHRFGPSAEP